MTYNNLNLNVSGYLSFCFCKCRHPESNWGHKDFQSFALPTELQRHIVEHELKNSRFMSKCQGLNLYSFNKIFNF